MFRFAKIAVGGAAAVMMVMTASVVFAASDPYGLDDSAPAPLKQGVAGSTDIPAIAGGIVNIALSLIGIIFFLLILYAGFNWMIARGNTEKVDQSKSIIEGAVIGLIIVMSAYAITTFVFTNLSGNSGSDTRSVCDATSDQYCKGIPIGNDCPKPGLPGRCMVPTGSVTCTCQ